MTQETSRRGKTTIAPDVLITIAKLAALSVPGVAHMGSVPGGVNRLLKRGAADGVQIEVENNCVTANLHIVVKAEMNVREISRNVQAEVARVIQHMVGMEVLAVNVTIDDVAYGETPD
ncbi:MAG: Asp23/Gls24 family envelope stress response protein [Chloroflexi bacterium]|nr:Asp23/Gls24 family envelope stress response protein [Chloroflexota bacterium]